MNSSAPTVQQVAAAAKRIAGHVRLTPLIECAQLNARAGGRVLIKAESLQRTGSFKIRGAYNRLAQITGSAKARGVVAYSSGNHAQGVAAAAQDLGMSATIVMPTDAVADKIAGTRALGAEIITYDRNTESREVIATQLAWERESVLVPSFDDPDVIAGQGTIGLEISEQCGGASVRLDQALVACGGGGLISGIGVMLRDRWPGVRLHAVEPEHYDDVTRSLASGARVAVERQVPTLCDALRAEKCGEITFAAMTALGVTGLTVTDQEVMDAMAFAFRELKLVLEPGGAVALAAVLARRVETAGLTTLVVLSGGNVERDLFVRCLQGAR